MSTNAPSQSGTLRRLCELLWFSTPLIWLWFWFCSALFCVCFLTHVISLDRAPPIKAKISRVRVNTKKKKKAATVGIRHGTTDWFQTGKGVGQGCIFSSYLFNFYAEYIMRNAGLHKAQARMKIAGRNISNLRYADETTLMAESKEKLKSLLMKVKRRVKRLA